MATNGATPPPSNLSGIARPSKGLVVVKPKDMRGTLMRLWQLVRKKSRGMGLILVLSALSSVAAVISPLITGRAVTEISQGSAVTGALIALIAMYVFDWLMKFLEKYIMASVSPRIIDHLRRTLFDKIRELPLSFFDMHQHGELMSRLTNDVDNISTTISNSLTQLLMHCFTVIGVFIMMMLTSPLLTLIAFAGVGLITLLTKVVTKRTKKLFKERQRDLGILNGQIEESISGLSVVKAFCREEQAQADFDRKNEKLCAVSIKALVYSGCLMPITNVINNLCYLSVSVFSALMYLRGSITDIGMITSFLLYVRQFTRPFMEVANIYNSFQTAVAGAERMFEMLDEQSEPKDADDALPLEHVEGEIEFDNVCFAYGAGKQVLNGISQGRICLVVCSIEALLQYTLPPKTLRENTLALHPGEEHSLQALSARLLHAEAHNDDERDRHEDRLNQVGERNGHEAAHHRVQHDHDAADDHRRVVLHTKKAVEERADGLEAGRRVRDKENEDHDRRDAGKQMLLISEAAGEKVGDRDGAEFG